MYVKINFWVVVLSFCISFQHGLVQSASHSKHTTNRRSKQTARNGQRNPTVRSAVYHGGKDDQQWIELQPTKALFKGVTPAEETGEKRTSFRKESLILNNPQQNKEETHSGVDHLLLALAHEGGAVAGSIKSTAFDDHVESPYQRSKQHKKQQQQKQIVDDNEATNVDPTHRLSLFGPVENLQVKLNSLKSRLGDTQKGLSTLREIVGTQRSFDHGLSLPPTPKYFLRRLYGNSTSRVLSTGRLNSPHIPSLDTVASIREQRESTSGKRSTNSTVIELIQVDQNKSMSYEDNHHDVRDMNDIEENKQAIKHVEKNEKTEKENFQGGHHKESSNREENEKLEERNEELKEEKNSNDEKLNKEANGSKQKTNSGKVKKQQKQNEKEARLSLDDNFDQSPTEPATKSKSEKEKSSESNSPKKISQEESKNLENVSKEESKNLEKVSKEENKKLEKVSQEENKTLESGSFSSSNENKHLSTDESKDEKSPMPGPKESEESSPPTSLQEIENAKAIAATSNIQEKTVTTFSYDQKAANGPPVWHLLNPEWTCKGRKQSPIDIDTTALMQDQLAKNIQIKHFPPNIPLSGIFKNNGHTPTFSLSGGVSVKLFGGTLPNDYFLKQLHFHFGCDSQSGSEHWIDGMQYPLEMHMVFWDNSTYTTFGEAAKGDRGIAVVALLFQLEYSMVGPEELTQLDQITKLLGKIEEEGDSLIVPEEFELRLETLIPSIQSVEKADRVFIYDGSLSTPGCYESVIWIVYANHPFVTAKQISRFRKLKSSKVNMQGTMCNNYRPIQKKYGRKIYSNII